MYREVGLNQWMHPAYFINIQENNGRDEQTIGIYTDVSKSERVVGSVVVIFVNKELIARQKFRLNHRRSKSQAEQLAKL